MKNVTVKKILLASVLCFVLLLFFAILYGGLTTPAVATTQAGNTTPAAVVASVEVDGEAPAPTPATPPDHSVLRTDDLPSQRPTLKAPAPVEVSMPAGCHLIFLYESRTSSASAAVQRCFATEPTLHQILESATVWEYDRSARPQEFWTQYRRLVTWPDADGKAPVVILTTKNGELIEKAHGYCMPDSAEGLRDRLLRGLARYQARHQDAEPYVLARPAR